MPETIVPFIIATLALALSPGPDNIYVLTQSLAHGSKSGIATTAGLISGCIVHTALLAFGVSALITASEFLFYAIKCIGAAYLLYLAYKVFKAPTAITLSENTTQKKSNMAYFKIGVIMNLVNPKVMLFFIAFFPAFLWNPEADTVYQFFILGGVFMVVSFVVFSVFALLAGFVSNYLQNNNTVGVVLKWLQIIVFVGIAIYILIP